MVCTGTFYGSIELFEGFVEIEPGGIDIQVETGRLPKVCRSCRVDSPI